MTTTTPATERGSSKNYSTDVVVDAAEADAIRQSLYRTDTAAVGQILPDFQPQLSEADLEHFRLHGYLAMNGLLTPDEVEACKTALSDLAHRRITSDKRVWSQGEPYFAHGGQDARADDPELRLRKLAFFVHLEPRLRHVSTHPRLRTLIDALIGPGSRMIQDMALLKPPFRGSEKPWHQDAAYFDWTPLGGVVGTWIALDEATVDNGCMQIIPGSHLLGPAPHFHVRDCQLADQRVQVGQAVAIPLQPGGILFFSGLLHHGTPPNMTAQRRRALQFHYAAAECRHMTIEQHGELFSEGGAYAGCRDWDLAAGDIPSGTHAVVRIAIGGITNEALGSSPLMTRMEDFHVLRGQAMVNAPGSTLAEAARRLEIELVPLLSATHIAPSGTVEETAYLKLRGELLDGLRHAGHVDGVCLLLHGAMLVENIWSGDTDLVREVRAVVGNEIPISVRLDLHANLNEEFANKADIWTGFRTAPHRDARETLERALALLVSSIRADSRPRSAFVRVPLLLQGEKATTDVEPMRSHMAMARQIEQAPGILNAEVCVGFGWADSPNAGSSVAVIARDEAHLADARQYALQLAQAMWDRRGEFTFDQEVAESVDAAIDLGLSASESGVFLTDSGDNPTAGTPGDSTYFLSRLLALQVPDAILAGIPDAEAARVCFAAGIGATVRVSLGGKWDSLRTGPLDLTGTVTHLFAGDPANGVSPMATLRAGGVHVIITALRKAFMSLDDFSDAGLDALVHKLVVVKLGYLMPALRDAAPREIMALSPGYADMVLERLPFRYVTLPIFPLDREFSWQASVTT